MKLRSTILGALAAVAMIGGAISPALAEGGPTSANMNVNVADAGTWVYWLWNSTLSFNASSVTASTGATATVDTLLETDDLRASSPGWQMQVAASDLTDGGIHTIPNENVSITRIYPSAGINSCANSGWSPVNTTNPFQTVTGSPTGQTLDGPVVVLSGTAGRGCGDYRTGLRFTINVPAGTYTGTSGTTYSTTLQLSDVGAPTN